MAGAREVSESIGKTLKLGLAATGSFGFVQAATPAQAAGTMVPKNPGQWADAFNAVSVGIGAGGNFLHVPGTLATSDYYAPNTLTSGSLNKTGVVGTFEAGKDFQFNNFVWGIYGDFTGGNQSKTLNTSYDYNSGGYTSTVSANYKLNLRDSLSLIGRMGWVFHERQLLYGLAGYTWQHYSASISTQQYVTPGAITGSSSNSRSGMIGGLTLGFGGEMLLTPDVSFKGEYRWTHFDGVPALQTSSTFVGATGSTKGIDEQSLRFVLSFKIH